MGGELARAEEDLAWGTRELTQAASGFVGPGWRELGVVRLRRGDLAGADDAFARALEVGTDPQPGLALLRVTRGELAAARRDLERFLSVDGGATRTLLDRENRFEALAVLVKLALDAGDLRGGARAARRSRRSPKDALGLPPRRARRRGRRAGAGGKVAAPKACAPAQRTPRMDEPAGRRGRADARTHRARAVLRGRRVARRASSSRAPPRRSTDWAPLDARRLHDRRRTVLAGDAPRGRQAKPPAARVIVDAACWSPCRARGVGRPERLVAARADALLGGPRRDAAGFERRRVRRVLRGQPRRAVVRAARAAIACENTARGTVSRRA